MPSKRQRRRAAPVQPAPSANESVVTAFRLKPSEITNLQAELPNIVSKNSHHLLARKVCRDFIDGKLFYLQRRDRLNSRQTS